ncbi:MAG: B12 lower ligand biosynthesis radical SAM protein BzaD [Acidobacteriota bacterium]
MRILLVQALSMEEAAPERVYPIGIVCLAGILCERGHTVSVLDMNMAVDGFGALKERLLDFEPELVGISLRNIDPLGNRSSSLIPSFTVAVRMIAALAPKAWLVTGGTGFSLFPERIMEELPEIDYGIVSEAESSFPALISALEKLPVPKRPRTGDGPKIVPPSTDLLDLSRYSPPARRLLDPAPYLSVNSYVPPIGIETKRGCPYRCSYCVYPKLQGGGLRCRTPQSVVDEMEALHKDYSVSTFHFTDPVLNIPHGHLEDICREILRRKLKVRWSGFMREDHLDEKNVALFEKAGCECFFFSADGLCQDALEVLNKGLDERDVLKAARLAAASDVVSVYHFMVNVPGESEATVARGIKLLERIYDLHAPKRNLGTVVLNNIRILPGTIIERIAREEGVITPDTDLLYPVYYNPKPFDTLRYRLQTLHLQQNVFMWHEVKP